MSEDVGESNAGEDIGSSDTDASERVDTQGLDESGDGDTPEETGPKKYRVKVDGEEFEVDEEELKLSYSKAKAADKRFREASQLKKQAEHFVSLLRTDPIKVLTDPRLGMDFRAIAEQYLVSQLEEEGLDPKEKELRDYKAKLEAYETQKKESEQKAEADQRRKLEAHYQADYTSKIIATLERGGLPQTNHTVKRMAYYMAEGLKRGYDLGPDDVFELVKKDYYEEHKSLIGGMDAEKLIEMFGKDVANKIRKHDLSKLKGTRTAPPIVGKTHKSEPKSQKISKDDWKAKMERMKNGLE